MAQQVINVGTTANDGTGDSVRVAFGKTKDNFAELYVMADHTSGSFANSTVVNGTSGAIESVVVGQGAYSTDGPYAGGTFGGEGVIVGFEAHGNGVAVGYKARATNFEAVAIGPQSRASGLATMALGDAARALPTGPNGNEVVIGDVMWATGNCNYLIGGGCGTARDFVVGFAQGSSIGYDQEIATADHQGFFGWYDEFSVYFGANEGFINDWFFGPVQAASKHNVTLNATSGRGTNNAGIDLEINASRGTGNAAGGKIVLKTSTAGASGTALQSLSTAIELRPGAAVLLPNLPTSNPVVAGQLWNDAGTLKISAG